MNYSEKKDLSTRMCDLSLAEFLELAKPIVISWVDGSKSNRTEDREIEYGYGMAAIMELLNCSYPTAYRIKKKGVLDSAITQTGRKIVVNMTLAREILKENSFI